MSILVTGGAGYIGSHAVLSLLQNDYKVVILDNFINSSFEVISRLKKMSGKDIPFYEGDVGDRILLSKIFKSEGINMVIHFAGLKSVSESLAEPISYYTNNFTASLSLIDEMIKHEIYNFVFSSSATVYGSPTVIPIKEDAITGGTTNPYGTSKYFFERVLSDICCANKLLRVTVLRYFNPVGAHHSGLIGEDPSGIPNNLMPFLCHVATGKQKRISIFGNDYPTKDGTGVRDFIHVMDLADGHVAAIQHSNIGPNYKVYNLGTGKGYSVLELISAFEKEIGVNIPYIFSPRRAGDIAECWSDPTKAKNELNWMAKYGLQEMVKDAWNWQKNNPNGYK